MPHKILSADSMVLSLYLPMTNAGVVSSGFWVVFLVKGCYSVADSSHPRAHLMSLQGTALLGGCDPGLLSLASGGNGVRSSTLSRPWRTGGGCELTITQR
jgi:hypothetical protein